MSQLPIDTIAEAFSRTAEKYDSFAEDHPHLTRMRNKVYAHVMRHVPAARASSSSTLEPARTLYSLRSADIISMQQILHRGCWSVWAKK